jgi:Ca-activated chloride channel family protein
MSTRKWGFARGLRILILGLFTSLAGLQSAQAAGLLVSDGGFGGLLAIDEHSVRVTVNNGIATTEVTQVFRNTENRQVEALYTFPVPRGATVSNFSMWINGKEMVGEVVEKQRAREIYNSYKQQRRDPGLLEQTDFKTFEMRIFPIAPNAQTKIQLTYHQELDTDNEWATYVYPLATFTSKAANPKVAGKFALSLETKSEVPILRMESPSHGDEFVIARHTPHYVQASLEAAGGDLSRDVVLAYRLERPRTGIDIVTSKTGGEDGYFYLTVTPGDELKPQNAGADYVFVLDVSGSMAQDGKLGTSRRSVDAFIRALGPNDRFDIITFNVAADAMFRELRAAVPENQQRGVAFLETQQARGGTVLAPAITSAYRYGNPDRPLNVVILSDGLTEQRDRPELLSLIRSRPANARVFCVGVGNDVDRPLLEQLAEDAGGLAAFVSRGDDFERTAQAFRRKLQRPAGSNVELKFEGVDVYDVEPRTLPSLYHGMPIRVYGRYRTKERREGVPADKGGTANVTLRADVNGSELRQTTRLEFPTRETDNPAIERMWAFHRVQRLLKDADRTGSRESVISEVVRLGEGYSIVTEYTSFLVLENDAEYQRWKLERRNALRLPRDRKRQSEFDAQLAAMRRGVPDGLGTPDGARTVADPAQARQAPPSASPSPVFSNGGPADGGSSSGGGAFDPLTGGLALGLAALGLLRRHQSRAQEK